MYSISISNDIGVIVSIKGGSGVDEFMSDIRILGVDGMLCAFAMVEIISFGLPGCILDVEYNTFKSKLYLLLFILIVSIFLRKVELPLSISLWNSVLSYIFYLSV